MTKPFRISLRPGEKIFVNGAVLCVDRKVSIEFLNDVTFLLESHVLLAEDTKTPLRQLYFIVQTILIDPANANQARTMFASSHAMMMLMFESDEIRSGLTTAENLMNMDRVYEALKTIRGLFAAEEEILKRPGRTATQPNSKQSEVAQWTSPASAA